MPTLPSLSQSLCLCFGIMMFCQRGRRRDEQSQWSSANSRLWLMTRGTLPSHWAEFTSSHNHLPPPQTSKYLSPFVFRSSMFLFLLFARNLSASLSQVCNDFDLCCSLPPTCLSHFIIIIFYSGCPESFHICSFWDKKSNPEPWNKLDPTYQYKVTTPQ